jgi:spore coat protein A
MAMRRTFIKLGLTTGAAALAPWGTLAATAGTRPRARMHPPALAPATPLDPARLRKFVDPLPLLPVLAPAWTHEGMPFYEVAMTRFHQQLHADLAPTPLWGYAGRYPGPTIEARIGQALRVRWTNEIAGGRFLLPEAFDTHLHGTDMGEPPTKTVVHLHGANVQPVSDGFPDAWFTAGFGVKGPAWKTAVYEYPNRQPPATLWYHDHAIGQTRLNVYAGLAGMYLLRDRDEPDASSPPSQAGHDLPHGAYEVALMIQDRMFDVDGSLLYPIRDPAVVPTSPDHPGAWVPEFFGNTVLVNGKVWPYLEVEPRRYRLRLLNASNARFYRLRLDSGQRFLQIGADHGYLPRPVARDSILLGPAERADVIVDFSGVRGNVVLTNDAAQPFPDGDEVEPAVRQVMQFRVKRALTQADTSAVLAPGLARANSSEPAQALARRASVVRNMALVEFEDANDEPIISLLNNRHWDDAPPTRVRQGALEVWHLINTTDDAHPIHLHQVHFQVLGRQDFDAARYRRDWLGDRAPGAGPDPIPPQPYITGPLLAPEPDETGFKDTVRATPGQVTSFVVRFGDYTGVYPWHCHILEHEDNDMMLRFEVLPKV